MKKTIKILGIIALVAVIGFSFLTCDSGGGGGGGGGKSATYTGKSKDGKTTYTLKITKSEALYTAQNGDDYELTDGSNKSEGMVKDFDDNKFTLKPSNDEDTFTAAISKKGLEGLIGTVKWEGATTPTDLPGELTPGKSSSGGSSSGGSGGSGSGSGGGGSSGSGIGMSNLNLSGQVYVERRASDKIQYEPYSGADITLTSSMKVGGTGSLINGKLSFSVGAPPTDSLLPSNLIDVGDDMSYYFGLYVFGVSGLADVYSNVKVQPSDTRGILFDFKELALLKVNTIIGTNSVSTEEIVYWYVDKDCTVTANGGTINENSMKTTASNITLKLKRGWNAIYSKQDTKGSKTGSMTTTVTIKTGDSSNCKWVVLH